MSSPSRSRGTRTRISYASSARASSRARGSTPAAPNRSRSRARSSRPTPAGSRCSSRGTHPATCTFINVSGTTAPCSPRVAEHGRRSVPPTRGRTTSTARCARRRGRPRPTSILPTGPLARERRHLGAVPLRQPRPQAQPSAFTSGNCQRSSRATSTSTDSRSTRVDFSSKRTGRSWSRTSSSATCPTAPELQRRVDVHPDPACSRRIPPSRRSSRRRKDGRRPVPSPLSEHRDQRVPRPRTSRSGHRAERPRPDRRYLDYFFEPDVDPAWREEYFALDDQVGREDKALVESVHRGMASGMLEHGRLLLNAEPLLAAFQSWVTESIR